ncbi:hypothetical protein GCM10011341_13260 [Frigidibacter albus]|nr:hypothetical protein GCM10011341_13260 [Frigidibacter albus]
MSVLRHCLRPPFQAARVFASAAANDAAALTSTHETGIVQWSDGTFRQFRWGESLMHNLRA